MGIRKHFEKKPPDENLKLQDLTLEQGETKPELKFDPETEVTESDWQALEHQLEKYRARGSFWGFVEQAMLLKIIRPDKTVRLNIDDRLWQEERRNLKLQLEALQRDGNYALLWTFVERAMHMKILQPDKAADLSINDHVWRQIEGALKFEQEASNSLAFNKYATDIKILQSDKFTKSKIIDDQVWQRMRKELEEQRKNNNWWRFALDAMRMKILQPDKFAEVDIDDVAWQGMRRIFEAEWKNDRWGFLQQAMCMKILAADKVEVTDQGLEITMLPPESFKSEKKPRPERKNF